MGSGIGPVARFQTSAWTGGDSATAAYVTYTTGTTQIAQFTLPNNQVTRFGESNSVSAAIFDNGGTVNIALSAVSTTTLTGGGGVALVQYVKRG